MHKSRKQCLKYRERESDSKKLERENDENATCNYIDDDEDE